MNDVEIIRLESCVSTNSYAAALPYPPEDGSLKVIVTAEQTAGRGQRGNHWEAEPGKNLTFSVLWKPQGVLPSEQFAISEAVALGVCDMLASCGVEAKVKWPNDIYVGEKKICGILIEHALMGAEITRTIAGVGINVNQWEFRSDAPNPVSLVQLTSKEHELDKLLAEFIAMLRYRLLRIASDKRRMAGLHCEYMNQMWRLDGEAYPFRDMALNEKFIGRIVDVDFNGMLHILPEGEQKERIYAFKEVEFLPLEGF